MEDQINTLDKRLYDCVIIIYGVLRSKGYDPIVVGGRRDAHTEEKYIEMGTSQTLKSYHITGMAADIVDKKLLYTIPKVHAYWNDLYDAMNQAEVEVGTQDNGYYLVSGQDWDKDGRHITYVRCLQDLMDGSITQEQADEQITWFFDGAHVQLEILRRP